MRRVSAGLEAGEVQPADDEVVAGDVVGDVQGVQHVGADGGDLAAGDPPAQPPLLAGVLAADAAFREDFQGGHRDVPTHLGRERQGLDEPNGLVVQAGQALRIARELRLVYGAEGV